MDGSRSRTADPETLPNGRWSIAVEVVGATRATAQIWDVTWATLVLGEALRERVCDEKLIGAAQEFSDDEMDDPILRGIDKNDPAARNPCLHRGPLSLDYWTRLPGQLWRSVRGLVGLCLQVWLPGLCLPDRDAASDSSMKRSLSSWSLMAFPSPPASVSVLRRCARKG